MLAGAAAGALAAGGIYELVDQLGGDTPTRAAGLPRPDEQHLLDSVSVVLDNLAAGESPERILDQYPTLRPEHIPAALASAAELARERIVQMPA